MDLLQKSALPQKFAYPAPLAISDGTIETLKWLAMIAMTLDHINKYLFDAKLPGIFELGRIAMPLFGFVLAYNLARPYAMQRGVYLRTMKRLALFGILATPFFVGLGWGHLLQGWWPLNVMFLLLAAAGLLYLLERGGAASFFCAVILFIVAGALAEFWWFGLIFCICAWWYCKSPSKWTLLSFLASTALLYAANFNFWALAAVPLILAAPDIDVNMPRYHYIFYAYYPAHLAGLWVISLLHR
jgi:hypothetical protein